MTCCSSCGCEKVKKARVQVSINRELSKKEKWYKINMSQVLEYKLCELVGRFEGKPK